MRKILSVVGNREQFLQQAIFMRALERKSGGPECSCVSVASAQTHEAPMSDVTFRGLEIESNAPQYDLGAPSQSNLHQIGAMLAPLREVIEKEQPDAVLLFGDTSSVVDGALAARDKGISCIHVGAGDRRYRRFDVPEEVNRITADHLSDLALACSRKAVRYLLREGFGEDRVRFVGDIMLDLFIENIGEVETKATVKPADFGCEVSAYILATIHRPENLANRAALCGLLAALDAAPMPVLLQRHPLLDEAMKQCGWKPGKAVQLINFLDYFDFLRMLRDSALVVSDSIRVTREAMFAGKGAIVPLDQCWWTEGVEAGLCVAVGQNPRMLGEALEAFRPNCDRSVVVTEEFGEGKAAERVVEAIFEMQGAQQTRGSCEGPWHRLGYFDELPVDTDRSEFSYSSYRHLVRNIHNAGYQFISFKGVLDTRPAAPFCLMRHDIDFDLSLAHDLARIEAEEGVAATYFFMVRTSHYNLFSAETSPLVRDILAAGHHLGLHFDAAAYDDFVDVSFLRNAIVREAAMLEQWFETPVSAVSFHRPNDFILDGDPALAAPYFHTYDRRLKEVAEYIADSGGTWKYGTPLSRKAYQARRSLHILIHPVWWSEMPASPLEMLLRVLDERRARDDESFAKNCRPYRIGRLGRNLKFSD